jgi:hypothetical protein
LPSIATAAIVGVIVYMAAAAVWVLVGDVINPGPRWVVNRDEYTRVLQQLLL